LLPIKYNYLKKKLFKKIPGTFTQENPGKNESKSSVQTYIFPLQLKKRELRFFLNLNKKI